jgi:peptide/nickel transport system permease protein
MATANPTNMNEKEGRLDGIKKALIPRTREVRHSLRMLRKSPLAIIGLVMIILIVGMALAAPLIMPPANPQNPLMMPSTPDRFDPLPPGNEGYTLGTGKQGVDIAYGIVWGARVSILTAVYVIAVSVLIGVVVGAVAGFYGGVIDEVLMRLTDIFLAIPALILTMAVVAILQNTYMTFQDALNNIMLSLIIVWWPAYARLVRGQVLSIRENSYVEAAKAVGATKNRILFRHIVPNSLSPMFVSATMDMGAVVLVAAALSYIGFGPPSGTAEWGKMVSDGQNYLFSTVYYNGVAYTPWWVAVFPGIMIFLFVMGFALLGDGLRDALDPRLRKG